MGGRGSSSRMPTMRTSTTTRMTAQPQIVQNPPNLAPTQQAAATANNANFPAVDNSPFHDLVGGRAYFQSQTMDIDSQMAVMNYLSPTPETGSLYSMSQNMNQAMATGQPLTANQQYVHDHLLSAMHNLGQNLNLVRYDHQPMLDKLLSDAGLRGADSQRMTEAQLRQALVGHQFTENKFLSTSHNNFRQAADPSTFTSRVVEIQYRAKASVQGMMPGNGPGGALGEVLLAPSQPMRVVDVRVPAGVKARAKGTQSYNKQRIVLTVEVG